ncbi:deoxyribose-phosphate aldolase [Pseudomonas sp. NPDC090202]|uniref:deoxyribose-phosphate aldolase n=1 Tax=unclassified Pseudomonas TaxID=196821 RepID=UPI0037FD7E39
MAVIQDIDEALAHRALGLLELNSLNTSDTPEKIVTLCQRALTPLGQVAAVCVLPRYVGLARRTLDSLMAREVKVVAAVNFPSGAPSVAIAEAQTRGAVLAGADEIDLVYPYHAHLSGDRRVGDEMIAVCADHCGERTRLTVTLETGVLRDGQIIHDLARKAIRGGASFLKTSTGKQIVSATPQGARILIEAIAELGMQVGFKASGNIRNLNEAQVYMDMASARFGRFWIERSKLRLSTTSLLDDLLLRLGVCP